MIRPERVPRCNRGNAILVDLEVLADQFAQEPVCIGDELVIEQLIDALARR